MSSDRMTVGPRRWRGERRHGPRHGDEMHIVQRRLQDEAVLTPPQNEGIHIPILQHVDELTVRPCEEIPGKSKLRLSVLRFPAGASRKKDPALSSDLFRFCLTDQFAASAFAGWLTRILALLFCLSASMKPNISCWPTAAAICSASAARRAGSGCAGIDTLLMR